MTVDFLAVKLFACFSRCKVFPLNAKYISNFTMMFRPKLFLTLLKCCEFDSEVILIIHLLQGVVAHTEADLILHIPRSALELCLVH